MTSVQTNSTQELPQTVDLMTVCGEEVNVGWHRGAQSSGQLMDFLYLRLVLLEQQVSCHPRNNRRSGRATVMLLISLFMLPG